MTALDPSLSRVEWDEAPIEVPMRLECCECCGSCVAWWGGCFGEPQPSLVVCVDCQQEYGGEG